MSKTQTLMNIGHAVLMACLMPLIVLGNNPEMVFCKETPEGFSSTQFSKLKHTVFSNTKWLAAAEVEAKNSNSTLVTGSVTSHLLNENPPFSMVEYQVIPAGSFIINMGVQPQTVNNALKPYGLVWDLLENHKVPIIWSINPDKGKDGVDFSYNGTEFKGGPFIISAEYRNAAVNAKIANWQALGVVGVTTTSEVTVPVNRVLSHSMRWTLDDQNGSIAQKFLQNAGIPSSGYNWVAPSALNCCNDLFVMPHAEPTWSTHSKLLSWNDSEASGGCGGAIWAGCKAVSELENIVNPNNAAQKLNFLMKDPVAPATTPAVPAGNHNDGNPPYSYTSNFGHPVMQFLGTLDGGQENGAEQVYLPTTGWRPSTIIGVWDPTQSNLGTLSPGPAAKLAFGHAFGNTSRGYVNYTGGHDIAKSNNEPNIAAQRTFFNFSFLALYDKSIKPMTVIPSTAYSGQSYLFSASATGGSGSYSYTWTSSCGGTFSDPNSASTSFTAPVVSAPTHCSIQLVITDGCGFRTSFKSIEISIEPSNIEICNNGIDDDGDGLVDLYDQDCCSSLVELSKAGWTLKYVDSQETIGENGAATNAFDGNMNTFWLSKWSNGNDPLPHEIQIDLGASKNIGGLRCLPRQSGVNGRIKNYEIYLSQDGINWGMPIVSGIWTYNNFDAKEVQFSITSARFVRLRATSEAQGNPWTSLAEIDVLFCTSFENCANGIDDDGDGFIDNYDTDCFNVGLCNNTPGQNAITGSVFFDPNGNLTFDNGEYTQPNVSISLYKDNNLDGNIGTGDDLVGSKETNAAGQYSFSVTPSYDFSNNYQIPSGCNDGRDGTNNETRLQFGKDRNIGLRFTGINIPAGSTITSARLVFVANANQNNSGAVDIYAHKTASPPDFCSNSNVNLRTRTTAKTAWTVGGWTKGSTYQSADIKNVLQEMTSTYGAYNNGTLALIMISTGSTNVEAKSFENNSALAPRLLIEYSIGGVQYIVRAEASTLPPYMQLTSPNPNTVLLTALGTTSCDNNFAFKKAQESCSNGLDDDGDGFIDCADTDCNFNLAASAGPNVGICTGGNTTLTASATGGVAPYTFAWSSGLGTGASKTVNPSSTTTYTVTVTSANGCTATNQVMVSVVPKPTITAEPTDATICTGGTNVLSVTATGGTPFLTYQWQSSLTGNNGINSWSDIPGATSNSYATAPLMVDTYYRVVVSANGNGCTSATSVGAKITVVPSPTITSHPASAAVCSGGAQTLTVTANGGVSGLSFQWQSSSNNLTFTNIGGATSTSYTTPLLTSTMYYRVVVSSSGNGCGSIISNAATVTVVPAPAIVTQPAATNVCMNGSGTFTVVASGGTPSLTYQWQKSSDNISFSDISGAVSSSWTTEPLTANTYYRVIVGASGSGCASVTSASALASVSTLNTNAGSNMTICSGSTTTLSASATGGVSPYSFTWSNGLGIGQTKTVSPTSQTTYAVTVTSAIGCTSSAQVVVSTNPIPSVNAGANKTICLGTTTTLNATASGASSPYVFAWNNGLGSGASKSVTPTATTTYIVTVTSNNGCIGTGATTVTVNNCVEICNNGLDDDGDGFTDCADSDCGPVADVTNNLSICAGTPALLTTTVVGGNAPYTYTWNNGLGTGANKTVSPIATTTYRVTVTAASGCTSTDQVTVTIMPCGEDCTNGIDDDFDGLIDCADPDCAGVTAPILVPDTYSTCPGMTFSERVTYNDANLNNPAFSIASNPQYGTVTIDATGKFTYVPTGFQCVTDYFIYRVCNQSSGCCQTATVTMNLSDSTPPVLTNVPADLTISCDDAFPSAGNVTAFDQCPGVFMDYNEVSSQSYIGACGSYTITKTWKATDFCGNVTNGVQLVNVLDQVKPELFRVYTLSNGTRVAAGVVQKVTNEWKYVKLPVTFSQKPLIFAQVSSNGEFSAINVQLRNVYTQGFEVRLREEEAADGKHGIETVSWIAMEPGSQNDEFKFQAGLFDNANDTLKTFNFDSPFLTNPHFFAAVQTTNETDPVTIRTTNLTPSGVQFFLQEETSADAETKHVSEKMGYLAIRSTSRLMDKKGEVFGELGMINLSNAWATVTLNGKYTKPVVIMGVLTNNDGQPVNVRVRNVGQNSFQVRLQEWDYQDGIHATEAVCWMVVEGGLPASTAQYCFGNANDLVPGVNIFAVDNCDDQVTFTYTEAPVSNDFGLMLTSRSWAAVDDCGNTVFMSRNDTCRVAAVKLKSALNGAMVGSTNPNLMRDDLRVKNYVPAVQPYNAIPAFSNQAINYGESEYGNNVAMVITANSATPLLPSGPPATPYDNLNFGYRSIANGNWNSASTWQGGNIPPTYITSGAPLIRIDHIVTLQSGDLFVGGGAAIYVLNGGKLKLNAGNLVLDLDGSCTFDNAELAVLAGNADLMKSSSLLFMKNSPVYVSGNFKNNAGKRIFKGVCMTVGGNFINQAALDSIENVCATMAGFTINSFATTYATFSSFKCTAADFKLNANCSLSGSNLTIWTVLGAIVRNGNGDWTASISKYCSFLPVSGIAANLLPATQSCGTIATDMLSCNCSVTPTPGKDGGGGTGSYNTLTPDFKTIANGLWSSPATWFNGLVPPTGDISNKVVKITHAVTLQNNNLNLKSNTAFIVEGGSLTMSNGDFIIQDARAFFINATFSSPLGELTMDNTAAKLEMFNCVVNINEQFKNRKGKRRLQNVCLTLNDDFINDNGIDTLLNLCAIIEKEFKNFNGGKSYLYDTKLKLNTGKLENGTGSTLSGDRNIIWVAANNMINNGNWKCVMDKYCVSGNVTVPQTYRPILEACGLIQTSFSPCNCSNSPSSYVENSTLTAPVPNPFVAVGKMDMTMLEATGDKAVVDWVVVELRNPNNDKQVIKAITALACRDGEVVSEEGDPVLYFPGVPEGQYYVVLHHRNHLGMMTDVPFYLTTINTPTLDFMDLSLPVRGGNSAGRLSSGKRTLWGGDYNGDGKVVYQGPYNDVFNLFSRVVGDSQNSDNLANYIVPGYELQDFNLDGRTIYQGPYNDRSAMLFNSILSHPLNIAMLANYIALDAVP